MRCLDKVMLQNRLEWRLQQDLQNNNLYGAAIHVFQAGATVYHNALGYADPVRRIPVTDQTVFRIASMTKPITAVAVMILVERGLLCLDDPVDKFLPSFSSLYLAGVDERGQLIRIGSVRKIPTVRNILSHTSGIGSGRVGAAQIAGMTEKDKESLGASISYFSRQGLSFEPGACQEYSGFPSFDVLTGIIEAVTNEDFYSFISREILCKCGMSDTVFIPDQAQQMRMCVMHDRVDGKNAVCDMPSGCIFEGIPWEHSLSGAGLVSTLRDYAGFVQMLLQEGTYGGQQILTPMSVKQISTAQVSPMIQPGLQRWGLGVRVIVSEAYKNLPVGAYGWSGAYGPHFWIDPVNCIAAVYMKNSRHDPGAGSLTGYNFEQDVYDCLK